MRFGVGVYLKNYEFRCLHIHVGNWGKLVFHKMNAWPREKFSGARENRKEVVPRNAEAESF